MEPDQQPDVVQQIADRRHQLAIYRAAYAETYGRHLDPVTNEAQDEVLAGLQGRPSHKSPGLRVVIDSAAYPQLAGVTGWLLAANQDVVDVKAEASGAIYRVPATAVRPLP